MADKTTATRRKTGKLDWECGKAGTTLQVLCETVSELTSSFRTSDEDTADSAGGSLPNKDRVIEVLLLLEQVIFPGRMSSESVEQGHLETYIEEHISRTHRLLTMEIARALPLRWTGHFAVVTAAAQSAAETRGTEPSIEDVPAEAGQITIELIRRLPTIRKMLIKDVEAAYDGDPAALTYAEVLLAYPGLVAITSHRIAHELYRLDVPVVPRLMSEYTHLKTGIDIHPGARIGERFFIDHGTGVVIGETTEIGNNVKLYQGVTLGAKSFPMDEHGNPIKHIKRHPTIEDDVVIYAGATILGGDTIIGKGSVIGGNVWLMRTVAPGSTVVQKNLGLEIREGTEIS